jgi:1-acylglycerone phosphate reductase
MTTSKPRVVLVTGCSTGGIGHSLSEEFARKGCVVYATSRNVDTIGPFKATSVHRLALNVNSDDSVQSVIKHIMREEGRIDIVVNNAGVTNPGPLVEVPIQAIKDIYETNVFALLRVTQAAVPIMAKQNFGTIVNIGSIAGDIATPWSGVYSSSKAAVASISEVLYMELKPLNISVLHVAPGAIKSNIANNGVARFSLPEDTLYSEYLPSIFKRIQSSQGPNSMPTDRFAAKVVHQALSKRPPRYMTLGGGSTLFSVLKWLPRGFALYVLWRTFSPRR